MNTKTTFKDLYSFPRFRAGSRLQPHPYHSGAMVATLKRRQKKLCAHAARYTEAGTIAAQDLSVISIQAVHLSTLNSRYAGSTALNATR